MITTAGIQLEAPQNWNAKYLAEARFWNQEACGTPVRTAPEVRIKIASKLNTERFLFWLRVGGPQGLWNGGVVEGDFLVKSG